MSQAATQYHKEQRAIQLRLLQQAIFFRLPGLKYVASLEDLISPARPQDEVNVDDLWAMLDEESLEDNRYSYSTTSMMDAFAFAMGLGQKKGAFVQDMLQKVWLEYDGLVAARLKNFGVPVVAAYSSGELCSFECRVLFAIMKLGVLGKCTIMHELLIAQSVANWLRALFKCDFAIATTKGLASTCSPVGSHVSFISFDEDEGEWNVVARKGFYTTANFQRDIHGNVASGVLELITWWHKYSERGVDYGDVKWPEFCATMRARSKTSKGIINAYNDDSDYENDVDTMLYKRAVEAWKTNLDPVLIEHLRPRFNPGMVEFAELLRLEYDFDVTSRLPIIVHEDIEYKALVFDSTRKRPRLEGNN